MSQQTGKGTESAKALGQEHVSVRGTVTRPAGLERSEGTRGAEDFENLG